MAIFVLLLMLSATGIALHGVRRYVLRRYGLVVDYTTPVYSTMHSIVYRTNSRVFSLSAVMAFASLIVLVLRYGSVVLVLPVVFAWSVALLWLTYHYYNFRVYKRGLSDAEEKLLGLYDDLLNRLLPALKQSRSSSMLAKLDSFGGALGSQTRNYLYLVEVILHTQGEARDVKLSVNRVWVEFRAFCRRLNGAVSEYQHGLAQAYSDADGAIAVDSDEQYVMGVIAPSYRGAIDASGSLINTHSDHLSVRADDASMAIMNTRRGVGFIPYLIAQHYDATSIYLGLKSIGKRE